MNIKTIMKMKKYYLLLSAFIGLSGAVFSACSSEEDSPIVENNADNAIRFAANTEFSRAGDITTNTLTTFNVYAYTGTATSPNVFMNNVEVKKTGVNTWSYSPIQYWPAKESVDFYAFAPTSWLGTSDPLKPIPYDSYPGTEDIIYAVSPNLTGNAGMVQRPGAVQFPPRSLESDREDELDQHQPSGKGVERGPCEYHDQG